MNKYSDLPIKLATSVRSLRDFLELLDSHGQCITWPDAVMPEPDIREICVAAGQDVPGAPGTS